MTTEKEKELTEKLKSICTDFKKNTERIVDEIKEKGLTRLFKNFGKSATVSVHKAIDDRIVLQIRTDVDYLIIHTDKGTFDVNLCGARGVIDNFHNKFIITKYKKSGELEYVENDG